MASPQVSNPNDFKVVTFTNKETFDFTPEMGCMFDSRPIFGISGAPGIQAGENIVLPFHVGALLARNLAKVALTRSAPSVDPAGIPTGVPLWDQTRLDALKASYIKDLYTEQNPITQSETDRLMAKVEEYKTMVDQLLAKGEQATPVATPEPIVVAPESAVVTDTPTPTVEPVANPEAPKVFHDKTEVVEELRKRGIQFDARKGKAELEKLIV